jgi:hypothetical protein
MKRVAGLLLVAVITSLLSACGNQNGSSGAQVQGDNTQADLADQRQSPASESKATAETDLTEVGPNALVPFRGSREQIRKIMAAIPGVVPDMSKEDQYGSSMNWTAGRFEGLPVAQWGFGFFLDQMTYAQLHFTTDQTGLDADSLYGSVSSLMSKRYGNPIIDSKKRVSIPLSRYTESDQNFISTVGTPMSRYEFRMWTISDSSARYVGAVFRSPRDSSGVIKDVYATWYDRDQTLEYQKMLESYKQN